MSSSSSSEDEHKKRKKDHKKHKKRKHSKKEKKEKKHKKHKRKLDAKLLAEAERFVQQAAAGGSGSSTSGASCSSSGGSRPPPLASPLTPPPNGSAISSEDFFEKNEHFRYWLLQHEPPIHFEALPSTEAARAFFDHFAEAWNKGALAPMLYPWANGGETQPSEMVAEVRRMRAKQTGWSFVKRLTGDDRRRINSVQGNVQQATTLAATGESRSVAAVAMTDRRNKRERDQATFEELVPAGGGGRGAMTARDRRGVISAKMHAASQQRDADADGLDAAAGMAAGADDDGEMRARLENARGKRQRREDEFAERAAAAASKEAATMASFRASMGLPPS